VGVDEAGRGPLAGPVVAAAVCFPPHAHRVRGIRDSKLLPPTRRAVLAETIRRRAAAWAIAAASVREIERLNIRGATILAMQRALRRVMAAIPTARIVLDGLPLPELGWNHLAVVDGDAKCYTVAAAGILAKTVRDALMSRLGARHPYYGWESNRGYSTPDHLAALNRYGPSPHHRMGFAPVTQLRLGL
jgi:ribonuclease HII